MPRRSNAVLSEAAKAFGVTIADIKGPARVSRNVSARRYVIARLLALGFDFVTIAKILNRHHSTIIHHVYKAKKHRQIAYRGAA